MTTIRSLEVGQYRKGDLALIKSDDPDPIENWQEFAEANAHDLRSIRIGGALVGALGYIMCGPHEVDAFAVIDRSMCKGFGPDLAQAVRARQLQWMNESNIHTAYADCPSKDRAARVFLRAIGYRPIKGGKPDVSFFKFERST